MSKYKAAEEVVNSVLEKIVSLCDVGSNIAKLCAFGDQFIDEQLAAVFNRSPVEKGIAYPTTITLNENVANFSPLEDEEPAVLAKDGDLLKISLGVHIDGYTCTGARSHVVKAGKARGGHGAQADAMAAAFVAADVVKKLLRPGTRRDAITAAIEKVAAHFGCHPVQSVFSCSMNRFVLEGDNIIPNSAADLDASGPDFAIGLNEVYDINIAMTKGDGTVKDSAARITVYQRNVSKRYPLRLKASRNLLQAINERFPTMPFCIRHFSRKDLLGLKECVDGLLLDPLPVGCEGTRAPVAQVRMTVLVTATRNLVLAVPPLPNADSAIAVTPDDVLRFQAPDRAAIAQ